MNLNLKPLFISAVVFVCFLIVVCMAVERSNAIIFQERNRQQSMADLSNIVFGMSSSTINDANQCGLGIDIDWFSGGKSFSLLYATVGNLKSDDKREIIASSESGSIISFNGQDGSILRGWPFHCGNKPASTPPIVYDIDDDGEEEIITLLHLGVVLIVTADGKVKGNDEYYSDGEVKFDPRSIGVGPLRLRKDWSDGLEGDYLVALSFVTREDPPQLLHYSGPPKIFNVPKIDEKSRSEAIAKKQMKSILMSKGISSLGLFSDPSIRNSHTNQLFSRQYLSLLHAVDEISMSQSNFDDWIFLDPHFLTGGIVGDFDGDGKEELVIPVSYFHDGRTADRLRAYDKEVITEQFERTLACGIAIIELEASDEQHAKHGTVRTVIQLDVTKDKQDLRAYITASPIIVDFNGDGKLDIIQATGAGMLYAFPFPDNERKNLKIELTLDEGFPLTLDAVFAQPAIEDVDGDGKLDLFVVDSKGTINRFGNRGEEIWANKVKGVVHAVPAIGDINGDGRLDIVMGTTDGIVFAFDAKNGSMIPNFPVKLSGHIYSPISLLWISKDGINNGRLIVIAGSSTGKVYFIDGSQGCIDSIDLGERVSGLISIDDVNGNGLLDVVVASGVEGRITLLSTSFPFHPLARWTQSARRRGLSSSGIFRGIFIGSFQDSRNSTRQVTGSHFVVQFVIVDKFLGQNRNASFSVKVLMGHRVLTIRQYSKPGEYILQLACPDTIGRNVVKVEMMNDMGQYYFDEVVIDFNLSIKKSFKWLLILPFLIVPAILLIWKNRVQ